MRIYVLAGILACLSCRTIPQVPPDELFSRRWVGHTEDDIFLRYGRPADVVDLSNGNHVDSYHHENSVSVSNAAYYQGSGGAASIAQTIYCDRRFEVDKSTLKVVRATIVGSSCDYQR